MQAASDVSSNSDRATIQVEVNTLIDEIDSIVRDTRFNGNQLIDQKQSTYGVNDGGTEGTRVSLLLPDARAATLGVSTVDVTSFATAENAIDQLDGALDGLLQKRAQLGAQIVSLESDAEAGAIAAVGLTQLESSIRDARVGVIVTDYTRDQIIVQAGAAVLSQANASSGDVLSLFNENALPQQLPSEAQATSPPAFTAAPQANTSVTPSPSKGATQP